MERTVERTAGRRAAARAASRDDLRPQQGAPALEGGHLRAEGGRAGQGVLLEARPGRRRLGVGPPPFLAPGAQHPDDLVAGLQQGRGGRLDRLQPDLLGLLGGALLDDLDALQPGRRPPRGPRRAAAPPARVRLGGDPPGLGERAGGRRWPPRRGRGRPRRWRRRGAARHGRASARPPPTAAARSASASARRPSASSAAAASSDPIRRDTWRNSPPPAEWDSSCRRLLERRPAGRGSRATRCSRSRSAVASSSSAHWT